MRAGGSANLIVLYASSGSRCHKSDSTTRLTGTFWALPRISESDSSKPTGTCSGLPFIEPESADYVWLTVAAIELISIEVCGADGVAAPIERAKRFADDARELRESFADYFQGIMAMKHWSRNRISAT
tara:strand:+ start:656 stop:1039 length:384 start_codon:yes stop_codon:yes gene_type:complete